MEKPFLVVAVLNRMVRESFFTEGTLSVFAKMSETERSEGKVLQVEGTASKYKGPEAGPCLVRWTVSPLWLELREQGREREEVRTGR